MGNELTQQRILSHSLFIFQIPFSSQSELMLSLSHHFFLLLSLSVLFWIWACRARTSSMLLGPREVKGIPCVLLEPLCPVIQELKMWKKERTEEFFSSRILWHLSHRPSAGKYTYSVTPTINTYYAIMCKKALKGIELSLTHPLVSC